MKRDTRQAYRRRAADTERMVDQSVADVRADRKAKFETAKQEGAMRRAHLAAQPAVDPSAIKPGMWVLNRRTFAAEVVKVNRTTVTVRHMGFEERWPLESIIAAAQNKKEQPA